MALLNQALFTRVTSCFILFSASDVPSTAPNPEYSKLSQDQGRGQLNQAKNKGRLKKFSSIGVQGLGSGFDLDLDPQHCLEVAVVGLDDAFPLSLPGFPFPAAEHCHVGVHLGVGIRLRGLFRRLFPEKKNYKI